MESNRRLRRPRLIARLVRRIRHLVVPGHHTEPALAGVPMAAVQDVPARSRPRLEPGFGSVLEPAADAVSTEPGEEPPAPPRRRWRKIKRAFLVLLLLLVAAASGFAVYESRTSAMQAKFFAGLAKKINYRVAQGPSDAIRFPQSSPYDDRLGYSNLPNYLAKLKTRDYVIASQARMSPKMVELADMGLYPTYHEKTRAGLDILDDGGHPLFSARFPERLYDKFDGVPTLLVDSLLFIENRELLDTTYPKRNPAVEWDRFSKAVFDKTLHSVGLGSGSRVAGGSTLATQIEKYRHSPEGRTASTTDKLRQMASAMLRSYQDGENTMKARRRIVLEYLNTVPLSAKPGYGEVNGVGDGMWVWYGREFADVNRILSGKTVTPEMALVYKEALSLTIAQRRPAYYLGAGEKDLEILTNSHLRVLAQAGVISPALRDAALQVQLHPSQASGVAPPAANAFVTRKAANAVRNHLANLLGDSRLYNLDRLDLSVVTTLNGDAQQAVTAALRKLSDNEAAAAAGLTGKGMLGNGDPSKVVYSFTLMERGDKVNYLRVQTDNYDQPLDINEGAKLDLGSTAKLRTLVTYLDIVDQLHARYEPMPKAELAKVTPDPKDRLSQWAVEYFTTLPSGADRGLKPMLAAAMERKYSGNPGEAFFTGGGLHTFGNFSKLDDSRILTLQQALQNSTNLVFVRLMRDVVRYYMFQLPGSSAQLLADADDPRRAEYLSRFADREGKDFLARFWNKYRGKTPQEVESLLMQGVRPKAGKLAAAYRTIHPEASLAQFSSFLHASLPSENEIEEDKVEKMYALYDPASMSLADRGYVASIHPLELWLVGYLRTHPKAGWTEVTNASVKERQEVYAWLFKTHRKHAQDKRIAGLLEVEAFLKIHAQWKKMGYPFDSLVPSYATTLGASADRPIALAELMGIIINGGVRKTTQRVESLHFAKDTPYETLVKRGDSQKNEQVLNPDVARAVADAIHGVAQEGTAKRVKSAFVKEDGSVIAMGGKTGTGDQRFDVYGAGGRLIESRYVNRSATFVFNIGERFFGSMTAYVHGPQSANYDFTSALPVQLLVTLAPSLMPMIEKTDTVLVPGVHVERPGVPAASGPADAVATDTEHTGGDAAEVDEDVEPAAATAPAAPAAPAAPGTLPKPAPKAAEPAAQAAAPKPAAPKPAAPKPAAKPAEADHPKAAAPEAVKPKPAAADRAPARVPPAPRKPAPDADTPPKPRPKPPAVEEVLQ
ncbi:transglycosylase domain-containing protein [Massilia sp. YIM B02763]|uniref:transglycosylase domain-containing protein n=1 Tax=Massilia sp. YIM B02763 TaxID=3050130 RepID=UPI0025B6F9C9|nr:transglycosylase domain-containing protein [Massilia sp. YIM B02763]MDN4053466.1 transglycosylase domain-containing protein [Massilia sp. YIM B02763]